MPNWGKLLAAFAEGGNPEAFARVRAQREEKINNEHRRQLLDSAESRAQASEAREAEANEYGKTRRGSKEAMEVAALEAAGLSNQQARLAVAQARAKEEAYNLAGGAQGEANETMAERKRRQEDQAIEQERLKLEARRTATVETEAAGQARLREEALREAQRKNRFGDETYAGSVAAENYNNSEEAREERRRAASISGLRNAGSSGDPIYDALANDVIAIEEARKRKRTGGAPPQRPVKERADAAAGAWGKKKPTSGGSY